jgi:hypothetical protein
MTGSDDELAKLSRGLPAGGDEAEQEFTITSDQAFVASATVSCWNCHSTIEVICIFCESGIASGEPLTQFSISNVWAMDSALAQQLVAWRNFREVYTADGQEGYFANHCPHCGSLQEDLYLHSEPDEPFFDIPHAAPGAVKLTPLVGRVQLSGDESFEI